MTEIGRTQSDVSQPTSPRFGGQEMPRKTQSELLFKWLRERDYPNKALDFLPKERVRLIKLRNNSHQK